MQNLFETKHILLVDDHDLNKQIMSSIFKKLGIGKVSIASNGKEAVDLATNNAFDLIFMDCQMPIMDGYDATKNIRLLNTDSSKAPIVALTANVSAQDRQNCTNCGMDDFLSKPINLQDLQIILKKWLCDE